MKGIKTLLPILLLSSIFSVTSNFASDKVDTAYNFLKERVAEQTINNAKQPLAIVCHLDGLLTANAAQSSELKKLYQFATAHNVAVFFVSDESRAQQNHLRTQLSNAGFDADHLITKANAEQSTAQYDSQTLASISSDNYDIVENLASKLKDLRGGFAELNLMIGGGSSYV